MITERFLVDFSNNFKIGHLFMFEVRIIEIKIRAAKFLAASSLILVAKVAILNHRLSRFSFISGFFGYNHLYLLKCK